MSTCLACIPIYGLFVSVASPNSVVDISTYVLSFLVKGSMHRLHLQALQFTSSLEGQHLQRLTQICLSLWVFTLSLIPLPGSDRNRSSKTTKHLPSEKLLRSQQITHHLTCRAFSSDETCLPGSGRLNRFFRLFTKAYVLLSTPLYSVPPSAVSSASPVELHSKYSLCVMIQ